MEDRAAKLMEILKNEYGIDSRRDLTQAMKRQGILDISPFCSEIKKEETK